MYGLFISLLAYFNKRKKRKWRAANIASERSDLVRGGAAGTFQRQWGGLCPLPGLLGRRTEGLPCVSSGDACLLLQEVKNHPTQEVH